MSLWISLIIGFFGVGLLVVSARIGAGRNAFMADALLAEDDPIDEVLGQGPFGEKPQEDLKARRRAWIVGCLLLLIAHVVFLGFNPLGLLIALVVGLAGGELFYSRRKEARAALRVRKMEFYLPMAMERVVMAVSSGLDIVPALREAGRAGRDPISELMRWIVQLAEGGTPVDSAFELAANQANCSAVKHALIHLGMAHKQGGEIVRPLKELSDASQLAYQEGIEEQIARLPVKAVLPLVLTFTGLIICFLTVPLLQVMQISKDAGSSMEAGAK